MLAINEFHSLNLSPIYDTQELNPYTTARRVCALCLFLQMATTSEIITYKEFIGTGARDSPRRRSEAKHDRSVIRYGNGRHSYLYGFFLDPLTVMSAAMPSPSLAILLLTLAMAAAAIPSQASNSTHAGIRTSTGPANNNTASV
jgi:hypothetical protein